MFFTKVYIGFFYPDIFKTKNKKILCPQFISIEINKISQKWIYNPKQMTKGHERDIF